MTSLSERETCGDFWLRLKDPLRWRSAVYDVGLWFMAGIVATSLISRVVPGYPMVVGTSSVATGIYWLDQTKISYPPGQIVNYTFAPAQGWIAERYGQGQTHTKMVGAVAGDEILALESGLIVCPKVNYIGVKPPCRSLGAPLVADSKGRPMTPWLLPGQKHTIAEGSVWLYGPNPKSLDSRYVGPVSVAVLHGSAKLLWQFSEAPLDPFQYKP